MKTVYKCEFCGSLYETEHAASVHEKDCLYNKDNKKCGTCRHLQDRHHLYFMDMNGDVSECGIMYHPCSIKEFANSPCPKWEGKKVAAC
jgi:hypothetical protein